ncbi:MAG TPA: STAS domain-containing protein [Gemmataceae bacterium]|nr:STAS domain-containing protein [Gemmataceae bacterium]
MGFRWQASREGGRAVIRVPDKHFDPEDGQPVGQLVSGLVNELGRGDVVLDFEEVEFVGSLGLATLVALHKHLRTAGHRLTVVNVRPRVYEAFALTRLTALLDVRQKDALLPACDFGGAPAVGLA